MRVWEVKLGRGKFVHIFKVDHIHNPTFLLQVGQYDSSLKTFQLPEMPVGKRYTFRIRCANKFGVSEPLESRAVSIQPPSNPPEIDAAVIEQLKQEQIPKAGKDYKLKVA